MLCRVHCFFFFFLFAFLHKCRYVLCLLGLGLMLVGITLLVITSHKDWEEGRGRLVVTKEIM